MRSPRSGPYVRHYPGDRDWIWKTVVIVLALALMAYAGYWDLTNPSTHCSRNGGEPCDAGYVREGNAP